ncbi:MAG: tetratricopeptide repeat protein [Zoogloeaceae bacterium]|nr:tetratricopeptide repeat protein [Zoogloeaceae bacterium]
MKSARGTFLSIFLAFILGACASSSPGNHGGVSRESHARALINKGVALRELGKPEAAIAAYDQLEERFGKEDSPAMRELVATALINKGAALMKQGKPEAAFAAYDQVEARFGQDESPGMREMVECARDAKSRLPDSEP